LTVIALCDVAKVTSGAPLTIPLPGGRSVECRGKLQDFGWGRALTLEEACVVRFLMVGEMFDVDVILSPPTNIPTIPAILKAKADEMEWTST
jgi:hypothetical protein